MNTRKKPINTTVLFIVVITVFVSYVVVKSKHSRSTFRGGSEKFAQQRRIKLLYHTDHEELLKAGREILKKGPKDPMNYHYYGPMHIDGFPVPRGIRIPKVIRKLRPHASLINFSGYVVLQMQENIAERFGVRIYPEGFKARSRYFDYGNKELLPGLWYYDREYYRIPQYDKTVDYIIQKGRWIEPNQIHLNKSSN